MKMRSAARWVIAFTALSCGQPQEGEPSAQSLDTTHAALLREDSLPRVLVLGTSTELASLGGVEAHFVTPEQWRMLPPAQLSQYQALVIGTGGCDEEASRVLQAASDNREVWSSLIDGSVFLTTGTQDKDLAAEQLARGVAFARQEQGKLGLYLSLGCVYESAAPDTSVPVLEPFGAFSVTGAVFTRYPDRTFSPAALAWDSQGRDAPYVLTRHAEEASEPIAGSPPLARCKTVEITATETCGFQVSIDAGSSDPDGDLVECTQSPAGPYGLGNTAITLTCRDAMGQRASCTGAVNVIDANAPTLSLIGSPQIGVECGTPAVDPGASAYDICEGDISHRVALPRIDTHSPGTITAGYGVRDSAGNSARPVFRTFSISDTRAPTITVLGPPEDTFECGTTYVDPGASANDLCFGDLSDAIVGTIVGVPGPRGYLVITYVVTDPAGNTAVASSARRVTARDTRPPMLVLHGPAVMTLECGPGSYSEPGASANDLCEGDVSGRIVRQGQVVDTVPGSYPLRYTVEDSSGNVGGPAVRTVNVVDTLKPVITVRGLANAMHECGSGPYPDPGASVTDMCSGPSEASVSGSVDDRQPGTYALSYTARDVSGNSAAPKTRLVTVRDTLPPEVVLNGPASDEVECGMTYVDPGVSVVDQCDGTGMVVKSGTVNPTQPGTYTMSYTAADRAGNVSRPVTRTVAVVDKLAPFLTLIGPATQTVECGTAYVDPGASATDLCAGDVSASIVRSGSVNAGTVGRYTLGYSVTDSAGNGSGPALRTVSVVDTQAPSLRLLGSSSETIQAGTPYSDPGAMAGDRCSGPVMVLVTGSVNTSVPGTYLLRYSARDRSGNTSQALTRTVTVVGSLESIVASSDAR